MSQRTRFTEVWGRRDIFLETIFLRAVNLPYSASKGSSDMLVRAYHHTYGMPTVITNCSNNYGPLQFPEKLIPVVIQNVLARKPVPVYGDGMNVRDWLYVRTTEAVAAVATRARKAKRINIGGPQRMGETLRLSTTELMNCRRVRRRRFTVSQSRSSIDWT